MKRATASLRRAPASMVLALVLLGGAGAPAFALDDKPTTEAILGFLGVPTDEEANQKIVFREHPKIVVPPGRQSLPQPQAEAERPASWPVDQETARHRGAPAPARQPGLNEHTNVAGSNNGEGPRKCLAAASDGHCTITTDADEPGAGGTRTRGAGEASTRSYLTEPPTAYRQQVQGGKGVKDEPESPGWTNPVGMIGKLFGG